MLTLANVLIRLSIKYCTCVHVQYVYEWFLNL